MTSGRVHDFSPLSVLWCVKPPTGFLWKPSARHPGFEMGLFVFPAGRACFSGERPLFSRSLRDTHDEHVRPDVAVASLVGDDGIVLRFVDVTRLSLSETEDGPEGLREGLHRPADDGYLFRAERDEPELRLVK